MIESLFRTAFLNFASSSVWGDKTFSHEARESEVVWMGRFVIVHQIVDSLLRLDQGCRRPGLACRIIGCN